jgi:hypothetical protein
MRLCNEQMRFEKARLKSFQYGWPHTPETHPKCTPKQLASAGFFFCPDSLHPDRCLCYCCGIGLVKWEPTDIPM